MSMLYAVKKAGLAFIYPTWPMASAAVKGAKQCKFKKFATQEDCFKWLGVPKESVTVVSPCVTPLPPLPDTIYSDGGCVENGTPQAIAGMGIYFGHQHPDNVALPLPGPNPSNNRAELMAALWAVLSTDRTHATTIATDSQYTINAATKWCPQWLTNPEFDGWSKSNNWDLIHLLYTALLDRPLATLKYIPGHSGHAGNEAADQLATQAIKESERKRKRV